MTNEEIDDLKKTLFKIGLPVIDLEKGVALQDVALAEMRKCVEASEHDREEAHMDADNILLHVLYEMGFGELCREFVKVRKWYA